MARLPRLAIAAQPHHAILRGHGGADVFGDDSDRGRFLDILRDAAKSNDLAVHAYVLMPNHVHLLSTPARSMSLAGAVQSLGRRYVRWFNDRHGRRGTLWEGRFRSTVIEPDRYLLFCMQYIESNPVRSGLVGAPGEYRWSSYRHHVGETIDALVTDHEVFWALGNTPFERQNAYRALASEPLAPEPLERLRWATHRGWALGSQAFLDSVRQAGSRPLSPRARGRRALA